MKTKAEPRVKGWYAKRTNVGSPSEQGLIIDENDGRNVAVAYDSKDGPILAAAPALLAACRRVVAWFEDEADRLELAGGLDYQTPLRELNAACAKVIGRPTPEDEEREERRAADKIDGYDRDDIGESPDY